MDRLGTWFKQRCAWTCFQVSESSVEKASALNVMFAQMITYISSCKTATQMRLIVYVTGPDKTGLIALFCISRNTIFNIECTVLLWWLDTVTPDILYNKCSYIAIIS